MTSENVEKARSVLLVNNHENHGAHEQHKSGVEAGIAPSASPTASSASLSEFDIKIVFGEALGYKAVRESRESRATSFISVTLSEECLRCSLLQSRKW